MSEAKNDPLSLANMLRPEIRADPYAWYAQIRGQDPVHWDEPMGFWAITRYADVSHIYRDARFSRAMGFAGAFKRLPEAEQERSQPLYAAFSQAMPYTDPPYHTRLRSLANKAFTPRAVERIRPHIQSLVDRLLDTVEPDGRMDVMGDFANILLATVIMELLGLPLSCRADFKQWSDDLFATLGVVRYDPQVMTQALASLDQATALLRDLYDQARKEPKDDLFTALATVAEEGTRLSHAELFANTVILLAAGHETTTNLIGNDTLALLRNPEQMQRLRQDPTLIENAVEEVMRYDNPVQVTYRVAAENVALDGKEIQRGQIVNLLLGAANRDPAQFADPDHFDITRAELHHMGFGAGIHYCIGSPLARLEGQIAFDTLLRRFPNLHLATDTLEWQTHPTFRGLKSLPVAF
ncbi:MAG: cytochrome P450 [Chloroflexi bacterium]|nr:cytochrome P450 [Chloroflexota bacterium]